MFDFMAEALENDEKNAIHHHQGVGIFPYPGLVTAWATLWGGVRLALLALWLVLAFAQAIADNANNTSLTPLPQQL